MILSFEGKTPQIAEDVFIASSATIIGDVTIESGASIWFGAVLRGDLNRIVIGANTSIQDNCVLHCNREFPTMVGANCVIGHGVIMEGCDIRQWCMIGMNATILSGAVIGEKTIIAAAALIRENQTFAPGMLLAGVPATVKRELGESEIARVYEGVEHYHEMSAIYREMQA